MAPAGGVSMEVFAPRRAVDHRLSLRIYFRTADNILKQASIYRQEANVLELYVLLLRYASLVSETIPQHKQFRGMNQVDKAHLKRKLVEAVQELEFLKPGVQTQIRQKNLLGSSRSKSFPSPTQESLQPVSYSQVSTNVYNKSTLQPQNNLFSRLPTPSAESLARHSFLGFASQTPRGFEPFKVQYPNLFDSPPTASVDESANQQEVVEEIAPPQQTLEVPTQFDLVNQLSPPPVPAPVQRLDVSLPVPESAEVDAIPDLSTQIETVQSKEPKRLHISTKMMDEFLRMAKSNTLNRIETCGVLAGSLESGSFFVTTLIIPKQEATANTCETIDEEEIFFTQDKRGLFQLGWIHTHPTQSCFMSSVDIHTHYSYQVMLPESIAIVMAPEDPSRSYGIFRLSDPGGMNVIQQCPKRGFHGHDNPGDGSPIYEKCSHVLLDSEVKFDVIDLR